MPILKEDIINSKTTLGVWRMTENLEEIQNLNFLIPSNIKNEKRIKEWICTRMLLKQIAPQKNINYDNYGAPFIDDEYQISISHANDLCCIILGKNNVSIDIEKIDKKIIKISEKFINLKEKKLIKNKEHLTLFWCVKECIFKLHKKGKINFKEDIEITEIYKNKVKVQFKNKEMVMYFKKIQNHYLVYYYD
ncbi:MAG: hypothetical protein CMD04_04520 [Flavobacteriales bacterium]|nr:hypothetical protein [Flavobacteriales bacterium]